LRSWAYFLNVTSAPAIVSVVNRAFIESDE
jgi:hypothetical protein